MQSQIRKALTSILTLSLTLTFPLMAWKALCIITSSNHPLIVVISQSMAPAFNRGDILFLSNRQDFISIGEIPVIWFQGRALPMVHRAIQTVVMDGLRQDILTKGDNNAADDTLLYPPGQAFVGRDEIIGVVKGSVPALGWLAIWVQNYPQLLQVGGAALLGIALLA